jgi:hypothetical protein
MSRKKDKGRLPAFVPLFKDTLATPAWRAMSHGARSLYVALKLRHVKNNGRVYLSSRDARTELGSGLEEIGNWFRELEHYAFIVKMRPAYLGMDGKGLAPHWRLTELPYLENPPTRDFNRWNGIKYPHRKRRSSRDGNHLKVVSSQFIATESRYGKADHPDTERLITPDTERLITNGKE